MTKRSAKTRPAKTQPASPQKPPAPPPAARPGRAAALGKAIVSATQPAASSRPPSAAAASAPASAPPAKPGAQPTRDRLIESAIYLFWERGFAGTSMADLLAHAEVNSGSFYHFFDSKEALLRAVLDLYLRLLRPMVVDPAFATTADPLARIFAILAGYRQRILGTDTKYGCPLGRLALEIDPENAPAHHLIAQNFRGWIEAVRECLDQMKDRLPAGADLEALATYVLVVMEGGVMLSRSYRSVEPFDRAVAQLHQHFKMLAAPRSKGQRRKRVAKANIK